MIVPHEGKSHLQTLAYARGDEIEDWLVAWAQTTSSEKLYGTYTGIVLRTKNDLFAAPPKAYLFLELPINLVHDW